MPDFHWDHGVGKIGLVTTGTPPARSVIGVRLSASWTACVVHRDQTLKTAPEIPSRLMRCPTCLFNIKRSDPFLGVGKGFCVSTCWSNAAIYRSIVRDTGFDGLKQ